MLSLKGCVVTADGLTALHEIIAAAMPEQVIVFLDQLFSPKISLKPLKLFAL
jgi:hypothetical protein